MWTNQSFYEGSTHYVKYDQLVIYDHALTMFYGLNAYLWFADQDEYLVIPHKLPHPQIHQLIFGNGAFDEHALCVGTYILMAYHPYRMYGFFCSCLFVQKRPLPGLYNTCS